MEAELVAAALTTKETVFCNSMMPELGLKDGFENVSLFIDNTSVLHVVGNYAYSPRAKHIALRYFLIQELVEDGRSPSTSRRRKTNLLVFMVRRIISFGLADN